MYVSNSSIEAGKWLDEKACGKITGIMHIG